MLLYLSLFTILISGILIINNWKSDKNVFFLASLFIILAIYALAHYAVVYGKSVFWTVVFYNNFMPLMLLLGPFLFFYIRGVLTPKKEFRWFDALHFLPFLINFIAIVPYYLTPYSYKEQLAQKIIANVNLLLIYNVNVFFSPAVNFLMRPVCFMIYITYSFYYICSFLYSKSKKKGIPFRNLAFRYSWFFGLLLVLMMLIGSYFITSYIFVRTLSFEDDSTYRWYYLVTMVSFICISFSLLFFPKILYGVSNGIYEPKKKTNKSKKLPSEATLFFLTEDGFNVALADNDPFYDLAYKIVTHYNTEKPYLKQKYSISDLSLELNVSENQLLYCFNSVFKISFLKLRNHLRIEYAKELLKNNTHENYTIDAIGQNSGFPTRSNFYAAFRKFVGCSPTEYLKSIEISN